MDNLSHTLAGLAAGVLLDRRLLEPEPDPGHQRMRQRLLLTGCVLASNFPDLDILLTPLLPAPLGYLLHHRGHTHTLLYAIPQALLLWGMLWLCWPRARALLRVSRTARLGLAGALAAGFGLHLGMDYLNSYGLHPFHPVDARWYYGDMVFILEPVFWVALGVPLLLAIQRVWVCVAWLAALAAMLAYVAAAGFLHLGSLLALYALGAFLAALTILQRRKRGADTGLLAGVAALALFLAGQGIATGLAERDLATMLARADPAVRLLDSALTAYPANPLCWNFVAVETHEQADLYRLRRGVLSLAPSLLPVTACPPVLAERPNLQVLDPALALLANHEGSLQAIRRLHGENCHFRAWMRFARAPLVEMGIAQDLRFSAEMRTNFTALDLEAFETHACPRFVPQWAFPRADMLGGE